MDVVFVTHNELGLACLEELHSQGATIQSVYTRPQRERVADQVNLSSFTGERDIPLYEVESVNEPAVKERLRTTDPDLLFVIGWSQLVEPEVLDIPSVAAIGMHPAPLPRGRGRAPIAWTLIKGLDETALSMFHLVQEADAGDIVGQEPIQVTIRDDAETLFRKVVTAGRQLIREYYPRLRNGDVPRHEQNESRATWWPRRRPNHGLVDWNTSPMEVYNWIRAQTDPYPGAFSYLDGRKITLWAANPPSNESPFAPPGEILYIDDDAVGIAVWEGLVEVTRLQIGDSERIDGGELGEHEEVNVGDRFENARDVLQEPS